MINLNNLKPEIRYLENMKEVVWDKKWMKTAPNLELYYMYRDIAENQVDWMKIIKNDLRYDITILMPNKLGKEFNKTIGHDHPIVAGTNITYPEIYEVKEGRAIFLLQDSENETIKNVIAIKAKENDKIIIPPNYEHLIINIGKKPLKICNWICRRFTSNIYKPFRARKGFCYYALKGFFGIKWLKNENYQSIPCLKFRKPNYFYNFNLSKDQPIYSLIIDIKKLDFLKNPQNYEWSLDITRDKN